MAYIFSFVVFSIVGILISIGDEAREECIKRERARIWHRDSSNSDAIVVKSHAKTMTTFETSALKAIVYLVWIAAFIAVGMALYCVIY